MKVRDKLSFQFTCMFAVLLFTALSGIYFFVENNRVSSFFNKLDDRAFTVAQFHLAEDNLSSENFKHVLKKYPQSLSQEVIRIYDGSFHPKFIAEDSVKWNISILKKITRKKIIHFTQGKRQVSGIYYVDNSGNFIVLVSAIDENGFNEIQELRLIMVIFFFVFLLITFFTGRFFSSIALQPIVKITSNLKKIRASSLDQRLAFDPKKKDEIDILSLTINQLLEHLEQSFESQQSFITHASHELRTPITAILGEAEITLMKDREIPDYKKVLTGIINDVEQLNYLLDSLIDMMQTNIDNKDFQIIRLDELLWEVMDELAIKNPVNQVNVKYNLPVDEINITLQGNRRLLFIAISNILKNSIKFSNGMKVYCELTGNLKGITITIRDTGIGINAKDIAMIFQPFFRSANATGYPGNGIGLSLTHNIIKLHNGTINVNSEINIGSVFTIFFPSYSNN